jgi:hypothetical protein
MPVGETVGGLAEPDVRSKGGPARTGVDREANPRPSRKWGAVLMLVLLVVALVWVAVRVVAMLRLLVADDDEPVLSAMALQDRPTPQDAVASPPRRPEGTFRETVIDVLRRPDGGPTCFGGRDDAAYLSGWEDAVDWIGRGQDAKAPTWGDLAYMTGWYDGVRDVAAQRAR